ncbi:MAG: hypothetical protein AB1489_07130 [Acidobacteriota bacterium]
MTLIASYQAFINWVYQQKVVRVLVKKAGSMAPTSSIRSAVRLLAELTIMPHKHSGEATTPLTVHYLEQQVGEWLLTVGGDYRAVKPGLYDLFDTTLIHVISLGEAKIAALSCPYCKLLLFGPDAQVCSHLFLRLMPNSYWAPAVDILMAELSDKANISVVLPQDFKKFLITNPQLPWQRLTYQEEIPSMGGIEVMAFVSPDPGQILSMFPKWLLQRDCTQEQRVTSQAGRPTSKQRLTKRGIKQV